MSVFRPAITADIPFLIEGFRATHGGLAHAEEKDFERRLHTDVLCDKPQAFAYILESGGDCAGFALASLCYFASTGNVFWVSQAYVAPHHRGKTFPTLMRHLKKTARDLGAKRLIWCSDAKMDRLPTLWRRMGAKELNAGYTFWAMGVEG